MSTVIRVENISKQYRLGGVGTGSLAHDVNRWWHRVRGREDPYLKIGETNDRSKKGGSEYSWALRDVSFEVKQGEVLGIIGRNGAGKSTLLKILSRVTTPTTGSIKVKGRIASLLEVGTGFHPELTGRENIFLNGAILGMRKAEIARQLDEIIDFSGCERYIDTPVKRYSSGMYVRLAFAVAAHLEPEILIIDEVLAVGDAEFQKKCLGKMKDVASGGRTVLFVSHNMGSVAGLCDTALSLREGLIKDQGKAQAVIHQYTREDSIEVRKGVVCFDEKCAKEAQVRGIRILNSMHDTSATIEHNENWIVEISYSIKTFIPNLTLAIGLTDQTDLRISTLQIELNNINNEKQEFGNFKHQFKINGNQITPRKLAIFAIIHIPGVTVLDITEATNMLEIIDVGSEFSQYQVEKYGVVFLNGW